MDVGSDSRSLSLLELTNILFLLSLLLFILSQPIMRLHTLLEVSTTLSSTSHYCFFALFAGQNFGTGFYNDHHFHYGYFIYAAAVLARLSPSWTRAHHERVLVLIRDIANPSTHDPFFTTFRHKDWYLGSSWASGIVTNQGALS